MGPIDPSLAAAGWPFESVSGLPSAAPPDTLWSRFDTVARQHPQRIAVGHPDGQVSYEALHTHAVLIGHKVRDVIGSGPRPLVAIVPPRDWTGIALLVGCQFAGTTPVILDGHTPPARARDILSDSGATVLIAAEGEPILLAGDIGRVAPVKAATRAPSVRAMPGTYERGPVPTEGRPRSVTLEQLLGAHLRSDHPPQEANSSDARRTTDRAGGPAEALGSAGWPAGGAYVLYTSGSSGRAKGVQLTQQNLLSLLDGADEWDPVLPGPAAWSCFHSFAFDVSMWEVWRALLSGAKLDIVPPSGQVDMSETARWIRQRRITHLSLTPTALRALSAAATLDDLASLRRLYLAGERLDFALLTPLRPLIRRGLQVWNLYGPTETTIYATGRRVSDTDVEHERRSIIGRTLPHISGHVPVADADGVGELILFGPGVAPGYLNSPQQTAGAFGSRAGTRDLEVEYRTQDLVRILDNGEYEFVARSGGYVKVRGFRVEPEDVAHRVMAHPDVATAVAFLERPGLRSHPNRLLPAEPAGDSSRSRSPDRSVRAVPVEEAGPDLDDENAELVVVYVPVAGRSPSEVTLRKFVADYLPAYLRPRRIVPVTVIPVTINGKTDYAQLRTTVSR